MTDISKESVERFSPYAVDGGYDAYGEMEPDEVGDYVSFEDYNAQAARIEQLEAGTPSQREIDAVREENIRLKARVGQLYSEVDALGRCIGHLEAALQVYACECPSGKTECCDSGRSCGGYAQAALIAKPAP